MRAARYHGNNDIRIEDVPEPELKPGHVMVEPAFAGICGSDLHEFLGGPIYIPSKTPHPLTNEAIPITLGHEFSGTVTAIGEGVEGAKWSDGLMVGSRVVVQPTIYDGTCLSCRSGIENMCAQGGFYGLSGGGGGLATKIAVPVANVLHLPPSIPFEIGALVEPLAVAWHACTRVNLTEESTVLVVGGGPIGIACCLVLRARGVKMVACSSSKDEAYLKDFGAEYVVDSKGDVVGKVRNWTKGSGVDVAIDCAGYARGLSDACGSVKTRGTIINLALWEGVVAFQPNDLMFKESNYTASLGYVRQDFQDTIDAIASGAIPVTSLEKMITRKIKLENLVEEGLNRLANNKERDVKIVVEM